jgi:cytochrome P450
MWRQVIHREATSMAQVNFSPYDPAVDADPFPFYRALRDEAPAYRSEAANMWVLSRYDDVFNAVNDWQTYSSARGNLMDEFPGRAGNTLGSMDPPRHDRLRGLIQHVFTKRNLEKLEGPVRALANAALDRLEGRSNFDFVADFSAQVTVSALSSLLGLPEDADGDALRQKAVLMVQTDPATRQKGPEHLAAFQWVADYAEQILKQRAAKPGDDLLSQLLTAEIDGDRLSFKEVQITTTTLIMAGIESLSGFFNMLGYNLATQHDARRKVAADPALVADALEESLRYNTSAQRFRRCLTRDVTLHGVTMPAGDFVALLYGSANRDERQFADPDRYDIGRKPKGHLGFGGGVHICLGNSTARLVTRSAFEELMRRVPEFTLVTDRLPWLPSSTFRSPLRMEVAVG